MRVDVQQTAPLQVFESDAGVRGEDNLVQLILDAFAAHDLDPVDHPLQRLDMNSSTPGLLSITNSRGSPKPMSFESMMPFNHLILCHHLLFLASIFPSIRVFSNESALRIGG